MQNTAALWRRNRAGQIIMETSKELTQSQKINTLEAPQRELSCCVALS